MSRTWHIKWDRSHTDAFIGTENELFDEHMKVWWVRNVTQQKPQSWWDIQKGRTIVTTASESLNDDGWIKLRKRDTKLQNFLERGEKLCSLMSFCFSGAREFGFCDRKKFVMSLEHVNREARRRKMCERWKVERIKCYERKIASRSSAAWSTY